MHLYYKKGLCNYSFCLAGDTLSHAPRTTYTHHHYEYTELQNLWLQFNNYKQKVCKVVPFSIVQNGYIIHNDIEV